MANIKVLNKVKGPNIGYWTLKAKTLAAAKTELDTRGEAGSMFVDWKPKITATDSAGNVTQVTFSGKADIKLPKFKTKVSADQKTWDKMLKALKQHEQNHYALFVKCLEDLEKWYAAQGDMNKQQVKKSFNAAKGVFQQMQTAYDRKSDHGKKEGVRL